MKKLSFIAFAISTSLLFSCSKDDSKNNAAVKDGNCTDATISAHNAIGSEFKRLDYARTKNDYVRVKTACDNFKNLIAGNTCKALNVSTGEETTVTSSSSSYTCTYVDQYLLNLNKFETPSVSVAPVELSTEDKQSVATSNQIFIATVLKTSQLFSLEKDLYNFQNGVASKVADLKIDSSQPNCMFYTTAEKLNENDSTFLFSKIEISKDGKFVELTAKIGQGSVDTFAMISCSAGAGKKIEDFKVIDLKNAFKNQIKFDIL